MRIGLTYDLRRDYLALGCTEEQVAEFDSDETISCLESAIRSLGHETDLVGNAFSLCKRLARGNRWDLVFNIAEGLRGPFRESQIPAMLELYDIPYTFSDPLVCAVTLDKSLAKRLVLEAGIRTPPFRVVSTPADAAAVTLTYPLFAKPVAEGTGKGIDSSSRIESPAQLNRVCRHLLRRYSQAVLVEEFLPGREFTVGTLGNGRGARAIGTLEIVIPAPEHRGVYSYHTKELCEKLVQYIPIAPGRLRREVEDLALKAYRVLGCRDAARVDIRLGRSGRPAFLEINPLPGLHPTHSDLPMIATAAGMRYEDLIGAIINGATNRARSHRR